MNKLIVITGPDGSGKSTLMTRLRQELPVLVGASIWDPLQHLQGAGHNDIQNYLKKLQPRSRTLFLAHALHESLAKAQESQAPILFDSYSYKYFVMQKVMGDSDKASLLLEMPKPDLVFYLSCEPQVALARKKNLGLSAYESGFSNDKENQFLKLQEQSQKFWLELLEQNPGWLVVSDDLSQENKLLFCLERIQKIL